MKFYRLSLLSIVCIMAFIAGWTMKGIYLSGENVDKDLSPVIHKKSENKSLTLLDSDKTLSLEDKKEEVFQKHNLYSQNKIQSSSLQTSKNIVKKPYQIKKEKEMEEKQKKYDTMNREFLLEIPENKTFLLKGEYSFLVNVFSEEGKALDYAQNLREKYPLWNFFVRIYGGGVKIYLGPFETKQKANHFMDAIPKKTLPFPNYFLEKQSL